MAENRVDISPSKYAVRGETVTVVDQERFVMNGSVQLSRGSGGGGSLVFAATIWLPTSVDIKTGWAGSPLRQCLRSSSKIFSQFDLVAWRTDACLLLS